MQVYRFARLIEQKERIDYLHVLCGDHGSKEAGEGIFVFPVYWHCGGCESYSLG